MTRLSVNINKVATIRNARGGNVPNVLQVALDCEQFGAEGITVHPRPDGRHIRKQDVYDLKDNLRTEFNIEGNPTPEFIELIRSVRPTQVTLVPDEPDVLTSSAGWNTKKHFQTLSDLIDLFNGMGVRTSIFVDADPEMIEYAAKTGTDRVELYTESYATGYLQNRKEAITPFVEAANIAHKLGLGINAGHDLSLENLSYFCKTIPFIEEVSIGHALISNALYLGLEKTITAYLNCLK